MVDDDPASRMEVVAFAQELLGIKEALANEAGSSGRGAVTAGVSRVDAPADHPSKKCRQASHMHVATAVVVMDMRLLFMHSLGSTHDDAPAQGRAGGEEGAQ